MENDDRVFLQTKLQGLKTQLVFNQVMFELKDFLIENYRLQPSIKYYCSNISYKFSFFLFYQRRKIERRNHKIILECRT